MEKNNRFVVIDFETCSGFRSSVCSVGVVVIENGKIVDRFYSLVNPNTTYFHKKCVEIHGITYDKVKYAPTFKTVWKHVDKMIGDSPIVAHNVAFEKSCIDACHIKYRTNNKYEYICTLKMSRKYDKTLNSHKLNIVAEHYGVKLIKHHNALQDAEACANIFIKMLDEGRKVL